MVDEYIYRLDYTANLKAVTAGCHRARRWPENEKPYPHSLLKNRLSLLSSAEAIYRICFFVTEAKAQKTRLSYQNNGNTTTLARCLKADVLAAGFTDSWDDGFNPGVAHLFWIEEDLTEDNGSFSAASIPFERFEALVNGEWVPLPTYLAPVIPPAQPPAPAIPPAKPSLVSRIMSALRSKQST